MLDDHHRTPLENHYYLKARKFSSLVIAANYAPLHVCLLRHSYRDDPWSEMIRRGGNVLRALAPMTAAWRYLGRISAAPYAGLDIMPDATLS